MPVIAPKVYATVDEGMYVATLVQVTDPEESKFQNERTGDFPLVVRFVFEIDKDLEGGTQFAGSKLSSKPCTLSLNERSNMYKIIKALLGKAPNASEELDTDELIGLPATLTVEQSANDAGNVYANIVAYAPAKGPKRKVTNDETGNPFGDLD